MAAVDASAGAGATSPLDEAGRRRRIRRRALLLSGVAFAFYAGFIALSIYRSRHG